MFMQTFIMGAKGSWLFTNTIDEEAANLVEV
jgi:hypothetical protein